MANDYSEKTDAVRSEAAAVLKRLASPYTQEAFPELRPNESEPRVALVSDASDADRQSFVDRAWAKEALWMLVESLPDAMVVINQAGRIILCNKQTETTFGYSRSELLGRRIEVLVPERYRHGHVQLRRSYLDNPRARPIGVGMELFGRRKDGSEVPVEISLSPLWTDEGLVVTSVIRDISQRQQAEAKFRTLVENIPAVTFIAPLDETLPELYVSPQIEKLLGFSQKDWLEDPVLWHRQLHPEDKEKWYHQFAPTCAEGAPFESVFRFIAKDGRLVWVHGAANLVRDRDGQPLFLQGVAFDITAIKEAEMALREQACFHALEAAVGAAITKIKPLPRMLQECAEAMVEHLDLALARIWTLNETDNVLELQARAGPASGHAGLQSRVAVGELEIGRIAAEGRPQHSNDVQNDSGVADRNWSRREGMVGFAGYPLTIDDRLVGVLALFARRSLTGGVLRALELVATHISLGIKRKQGEEELERRVEQRTEELKQSLAALEEKTDDLEQFAHVAAHDFREPLRSLLNYPQKLAKKYLDDFDEEGAEWLRRTLAGGERMRRLIEDVGEYSRIIRRRRVFETVNCNDVLNTAEANLQVAIQETEAEVNSDRLPTVQAHHTDLIILFQNLIANAVKFRSPGQAPKIQVGARRQDDEWLFWVRDNGIGMEAKYLKRIFELGERLHSTSKYSGTGFGLAICEKIVRRHGGRIWAESAPDRGTTVYFTLADGGQQAGTIA